MTHTETDTEDDNIIRDATEMDRHEAMLMHAQGSNVKEIAHHFSRHVNTISKWKNKNLPENWEKFAIAMAREVIDAAKQKIKVEAAVQIGEQWKDSKRQRTMAQGILGKIAEELTAPNPGTDIIKLALAAAKATNILRSVQTQQMELMGMPNVRIGRTEVESPISKLLGEEAITDMDLGELTQHLIDDSNPTDVDEDK